MKDLILTCNKDELGEVNLDDFLLMCPMLGYPARIETGEILEVHKTVAYAVASINHGAFSEVLQISEAGQRRKSLERVAVILYHLGLLSDVQCLGGYRFSGGLVGIAYKDVGGAHILVLLQDRNIHDVLVTRVRAYAAFWESFPTLDMRWNAPGLISGQMPEGSGPPQTPKLRLDGKAANMVRATIHKIAKGISAGDLSMLLSILEPGDTPRMRLARVGEAVIKLSDAARLTVLAITAVGNQAYSVCCQMQNRSLIFILLDRAGHLIEVHLPLLLATEQPDFSFHWSQAKRS